MSEGYTIKDVKEAYEAAVLRIGLEASKIVPDIKDPKPYFFVNIKDQFNLSNDVDFLGVPSTTSGSGKVELH